MVIHRMIQHPKRCTRLQTGGKPLTRQALALAGLFQRRRRAIVGHVAGQQVGGTGTAAAVAATVGQAYVLADRCIGNRLISGIDIRQPAKVAGALYVVLPPQGIDTAAFDACQ